MKKHKIFRTGNNIAHTTYYNHRRAETLYTLKTWFVLGINSKYSA
jgi:hypothetical protein